MKGNKERSNYGNKNNFRFKGNHKRNFILIASVKKKKVSQRKRKQRGKNCYKNFFFSNNKVIKIKHLSYNKSEVHFKNITFLKMHLLLMNI